MDMWPPLAGPFLIPVVAILAWFILALVKTSHRARIRELEIRERIAMIERGMVPPPEVDPGGFDRAMRRYDRLRALETARFSRSGDRHRRAGIVLLGVGLGLMVLISFSGAPDEAVGVGGFVAILGLAFLLNSLFERGGVSPASTEGARPIPPVSSAPSTSSSTSPPSAPPSTPSSMPPSSSTPS